MSESKIKAIALISSGLDSLLAAKIVKDLGIDVHGVCFYFDFDNLADKAKRGDVEALVKPLDIPLSCINVSEEYLHAVFLNPAHGYGSCINPCIDCHLFFLKKARAMMDEMGARFMVTGEVVGQRPMSQNRPMLIHIDKISGFGDLVLRPLSAKLLAPTLAETKGWIDREKLYDISGRSRRRQIELVEALGIEDFSSPAGGCILTEPAFSKRAKAFFVHRGKDEVTIEELKLLRYGRLFWPKHRLQVVVGRNAEENLALEAFKAGRWAFEAADTHQTPLVLAHGIDGEEDIRIVAEITARYTKGHGSEPMRIRYTRDDGEEGVVHAVPASEDVLGAWRV